MGILHRVRITGEGDPAQQPQTLTTKISLRNRLCIEEKQKLSNTDSDRDSRLSVADKVDSALTVYFESLPPEQRTVIDRNVRSSIEFLVEVEPIRAQSRGSSPIPE